MTSLAVLLLVVSAALYLIGMQAERDGDCEEGHNFIICSRWWAVLALVVLLKEVLCF